MFKVIAIYFHEVSDDPFKRVTETLVHLSDTMEDAQVWACNECFDKGTSYEFWGGSSMFVLPVLGQPS